MFYIACTLTNIFFISWFSFLFLSFVTLSKAKIHKKQHWWPKLTINPFCRQTASLTAKKVLSDHLYSRKFVLTIKMSSQYLTTFSPTFTPDQHKSTYFYASVFFFPTQNRIFFVTGSLKGTELYATRSSWLEHTI